MSLGKEANSLHWRRIYFHVLKKQKVLCVVVLCPEEEASSSSSYKWPLSKYWPFCHSGGLQGGKKLLIYFIQGHTCNCMVEEGADLQLHGGRRGRLATAWWKKGQTCNCMVEEGADLQLYGGRRGRLALWKRLTPRAGLGLSMEVGVGMGGPGQGAETSFFSESVPGGPVGETCSFCSLFYRWVIWSVSSFVLFGLWLVVTADHHMLVLLYQWWTSVTWWF